MMNSEKPNLSVKSLFDINLIGNNTECLKKISPNLLKKIRDSRSGDFLNYKLISSALLMWFH